MKDYQASLERLRKDASEHALLRDRATDPTKRKIYDVLSRHLTRLADEVEKAAPRMPAGQKRPSNDNARR